MYIRAVVMNVPFLYRMNLWNIHDVNSDETDRQYGDVGEILCRRSHNLPAALVA